MLDLLVDPFQTALAQRALAEVAILGLVCGPLSVWVVLMRHSYAAESISHGMLPGLVAAALAGLPLGLGAAVGLAVAAAAIAAATRLDGIESDTAVAVVVTGLFGLGSLLALSPETPVRLGELLFGDPLSISGQDLLASGVLAAAVGGGLVAFGRPLALAGFDPPSAPSLGGRPALAGLIVLGLLAATTLIAVQALGNLLVVTLLVAPGATALRLTGRLGRALGVAAILAFGAGATGLYLSYYLDVAAGAAIALCSISLYLVAAIGDARPRDLASRPA